MEQPKVIPDLPRHPAYGKQEASGKAKEGHLCYKCGNAGHIFENCQVSIRQRVWAIHFTARSHAGTRQVNAVSGGQDVIPVFR